MPQKMIYIAIPNASVTSLFLCFVSIFFVLLGFIYYIDQLKMDKKKFEAKIEGDEITLTSPDGYRILSSIEGVFLIMREELKKEGAIHFDSFDASLSPPEAKS